MLGDGALCVGRDPSLVCSQSSLKQSTTSTSSIQFCHAHAPTGSTHVIATQPHRTTPAAPASSSSHLRELAELHQSESCADAETSSSVSEDFNDDTTDNVYLLVMSRLADRSRNKAAGAGGGGALYAGSLYVMPRSALDGGTSCQTPGCERPAADCGGPYCVGCRNKEATDASSLPAIEYPGDDDDDAASVDDGGDVSDGKKVNSEASAGVETHSLHGEDGSGADNDNDGDNDNNDSASFDDVEFSRGKLTKKMSSKTSADGATAHSLDDDDDDDDDNNDDNDNGESWCSSVSRSRSHQVSGAKLNKKISGEASAEQEVEAPSLDDDDDDDAEIGRSSSSIPRSRSANRSNTHQDSSCMNRSRQNNNDNIDNSESAFSSSSSSGAVAVEVTRDARSVNGSRRAYQASCSSPCRGPHCTNAGLQELRGLCEACYRTLLVVNYNLRYAASPEDVDAGLD